MQTARSRLYSDSAAQAIPAQRLSRFFVCREAGGYRVTKMLRERVLFARHDVISDPPFIRLDILSCRNLLIYFKPTLQRKLLPLFHYALQPGGVLLLGNSRPWAAPILVCATECQGPHLQPPRQRRRARCGADYAQACCPTALAPEDAIVPESSSPEPLPLQTLADRLMLQEFAPPAVLVNEQGDILYVSGRTGRYLEPAAGKAN